MKEYGPSVNVLDETILTDGVAMQEEGDQWERSPGHLRLAEGKA